MNIIYDKYTPKSSLSLQVTMATHAPLAWTSRSHPTW
jgi:hypothetical protein